MNRRLFGGREPELQPRIFLSYRRGDAAPYAGRLYDALTLRFGARNVFMDVDTIGLGADFHEAIEAALAQCDVALALIGPSWVVATDEQGRRRLDDPADVLRLELEAALSRDLVVIPVCVQGAEPPVTAALPESLAPLARRQAAELRDSSWGADVERLVRTLEGLPGGEAAPSAPTPPAAPRQPIRRRAVAAGLAVVLAAAAVAVALALDGSDGEDGGGGAASGDERALLALIPQPLRSGCSSIDYGPEPALASVGCSGARLSAEYHLFESPAVLNGWYELEREEAGIEPDTGSCTENAFRGESTYTVAGEEAGRSFCYVDEDRHPHLFWIDRRATVGAHTNIWEGEGPTAVESLLRQRRCCLELEP